MPIPPKIKQTYTTLWKNLAWDKHIKNQAKARSNFKLHSLLDIQRGHNN